MEQTGEDWLNEGCLPEVIVGGIALTLAVIIVFSINPFASLAGLLILIPVGALLAVFLIALRCVWRSTT